MEKINQESEKPLSYTEEYYPDWSYNPGELIRLAVWHKKELPDEAVDKIQKAIDDILGRDERPGQWTLDENEFKNLVEGFAQCQTIPNRIMNDLIEIMKLYKKKQHEQK